MHDVLAAAITRRFAGARCQDGGASVQVELESEGMTFRARAALEPVGIVAVLLPATDGFELSLAWTDRSQNARAPTFDDSFLVETNDVALATAWLDRDARDWLLASRYVPVHEPERETALLVRDGTWRHELRGDEITARRDDPERSPERVADMLIATVALASRPVRWARSLAPLGRALGAQVTDRVELGGRPVLRVRRGGVEVHVRMLRRLGPADPGRLRTVISAHRRGAAGETLSLIADDLPRAAWPPPTDGRGNTLRIDARAPPARHRAALHDDRPTARRRDHVRRRRRRCRPDRRRDRARRAVVRRRDRRAVSLEAPARRGPAPRGRAGPRAHVPEAGRRREDRRTHRGRQGARPDRSHRARA